MSRMTVIAALSLALLIPKLAGAAETTVEMWMPDGQLMTNPVRIYVTRNISLDMKPTLQLIGSHSITTKQAGESRAIAPQLVAPDQTWEGPASGGNRIQRSGSVLLFDLSTFPIPKFKSMMRLTPVLRWSEGGQPHTVISDRPVNLGNPVTAWATSTAVMAATLLAIVAILRKRVGFLLLGDDRRLSLSRIQIAAWTLAVGTIVFGHGLIQLDVPTIPESIVTLLGLSLVTGGISYLRPKHADPAPVPPVLPAPPFPETPPAPPVPPVRWSLSDLLCDDRVPSISRAQMLFWTVLMVSLFVVKSVLNGVVWEVPWAMVALMGISQGGYLAPKFAPEK